MTWAEWLLVAAIVVCLVAIPVLRWIDRANRVIDRTDADADDAMRWWEL